MPIWQVPRMIARRPGRAGDLWFLAAAAAIFLAQQLAISFMATSGFEGIARRTLFFATTAVLVLLALRFRRFWGAWLVAAGIVLNLIPMAAHGGAMPVDIAIIESSGAFPEITREHLGSQTNHGKDVVLERDEIHFFALSDRYVVELPGYGTNIYSLGDFVLFAGVALIIIQAPVDLLRSQRQETPQAA
ncbi:MAG TPA: DUF5317 family protein [Tepidiformaceae bacterium]|nr:DUF5317 family protein [Tepidiformaceae bacterium]